MLRSSKTARGGEEFILGVMGPRHGKYALKEKGPPSTDADGGRSGSRKKRFHQAGTK